MTWRDVRAEAPGWVRTLQQCCLPPIFPPRLTVAQLQRPVLTCPTVPASCLATGATRSGGGGPRVVHVPV